jgi:hypothetical protein
MSSCSRASGRADVVARGLVVQALPVASDSPQRLGETWTRHSGTVPRHDTAHPASSLHTSSCALPAPAPCATALDAEHTATRLFTLERDTPRCAEVQGHREMRGAGIPHGQRGRCQRHAIRYRTEVESKTSRAAASVPPCRPCYCRTAAPWVVCRWCRYRSSSAAACLRA